MKPPSSGRRGPPPDRAGSGPRGAFHGSRPKPEPSHKAKAAPPPAAAPAAPRSAPRPDKPDRPILRAVTPVAPPSPRVEAPSQLTRGQVRGSQAANAPKGTVWLYGLHAVAAALANPARRLRRLVLTEEAEAALAARLPPPWPLAAERTERTRIDQMLGRDIVHQGAALLADPLAPPVLAQVLERPGPLLVLDQVSDPRNVGAILRSAAAFGAAGVISQDRNAPEETGAMAKAASGALETVPLVRAVNLARTLVALKAAGAWVVGLDAGGVGLSGAALAQRRVVLVLGAEESGLRRLTRETCDEIASLPMPGGMESLNVAAAAAVALYELTRM
jgi:23S rRNA (guanosine2251-2'-O)-methyltransferase